MSYEESLDFHQMLLEPYKKLGYNLIEVPRCSTVERARFILNHIQDSKKSKFPVFKKLSFGGLSHEELKKQLYEKNIQFNEYAKKLFEQNSFSLPAEIKAVDLVKIKLKDIGLIETCTFEEFSLQVQAHGLELCPLSLAAFLRLDYLDQADGPFLTIASPKPQLSLDDTPNFPVGFYLRNYDNHLWLRGYYADGFEGWPESNEFVLIKNDY